MCDAPFTEEAEQMLVVALAVALLAFGLGVLVVTAWQHGHPKRLAASIPTPQAATAVG